MSYSRLVNLLFFVMVYIPISDNEKSNHRILSDYHNFLHGIRATLKNGWTMIDNDNKEVATIAASGERKYSKPTKSLPFMSNLNPYTLLSSDTTSTSHSHQTD